MVPTHGDLRVDMVELLGRLVQLAKETADVPAATVDGVLRAHVRLEDDGLHRFLLEVRRGLLEDLRDVAHAEEAVRVLEHLRLVGGEVGGEGAFLVALPPLELADRARLARPSFDSHVSFELISVRETETETERGLVKWGGEEWIWRGFSRLLEMGEAHQRSLLVQNCRSGEHFVDSVKILNPNKVEDFFLNLDLSPLE